MQLQGTQRAKAAQNPGVGYAAGGRPARCVATPLPARLRHRLAGLGPGTKHTFPDRTATRVNVDVCVDGRCKRIWRTVKKYKYLVDFQLRFKKFYT